MRRLLADRFEELMAKLKVDSTTVASVLVSDLRDLRREGVDVSIFTNEKLTETFKLLEENKISKDALKDLMLAVSKKPEEPVEKMVKERQMGAMGPLMGMSMKQLKGKADGSLVNKIVREEIQKLL